MSRPGPRSKNLEVSRAATERDEYERESRRLRYTLYEHLLAETGAPAVMVGHHQGDVQENVVSNLMRGASLLNVGGMGPVGVSAGVTIWRPLLCRRKAEIFDYAHRHGLPYFKDTTPLWSTRGKLRRQLLPLLEVIGTLFCSRSRIMFFLPTPHLS